MLADYSFDIKYKPGSKMAVPDALSRLPHDYNLHRSEDKQGETKSAAEDSTGEDSAQEEEQESSDIEFINRNTALTAKAQRDGTLAIFDLPKEGVVMSIADMQQAQANDLFCSQCISYLMHGTLPDEVSRANLIAAHARMMGLTGEPGLLVAHYDTVGEFRRRIRRVQLVVPEDEEIRTNLIKWAHSFGCGGHTGASKTFQLLRQHYWWRNSYHSVVAFVRRCTVCQLQKNPLARLRARPGVCRRPTPTAPWETIHIDACKIMGKDVMLFVCGFTRWPEAMVFEEPPNGNSLSEALIRKVISRHGTPSEIFCDSVSYQASGTFRAFCARLNIRVRLTSAYQPTSNGLVESKVRMLKMLLRAVAFENPHCWRAMIPLALMVYRCSFNRNTGETPFFLNHGRDCTLPCAFNRAVENMLQETEVERPDVYAASLVRRVQEGCRVARRNLAKMRDVLMDQDLLPDYFQVGDEVMLFTPKVRTSSQIFRNAWSGPYRIQRAHSKVVMDLVHTQKPTDQRLAHVSRLKRKL